MSGSPPSSSSSIDNFSRSSLHPSMPSPSAYAQFSEDPIPLTRHQELDMSMCTCCKVIDLDNLRTAARLLYYVLLDAFDAYPDHFVRPVEKNLRQTLEDNESVHELLKDCWDTRVYLPIRRLKLFRKTLNPWHVRERPESPLVSPLPDPEQSQPAMKICRFSMVPVDKNVGKRVFSNDLERLDAMRWYCSR